MIKHVVHLLRCRDRLDKVWLHRIRIRIRDGFWTNCHPTQLCNRLGPESLTLIHMFAGDRRMEAAVHSLFPPVEYEFWDRSQLEQVLQMLRHMVEELPVPPRPPLFCISDERLPRCDGEREYACEICGEMFSRAHVILEHRSDVHLKRKWRCAC